MAATQQPRSLVSRRRRRARGGDEEEEEEDALVMIEDSQSERSIISGNEESEDDKEIDNDISEGEDTEHPIAAQTTERSKQSSRKIEKPLKSRRKVTKKDEGGTIDESLGQVEFKPSADTEVMLQRRHLHKAAASGDMVDFEAMEANLKSAPKAAKQARADETAKVESHVTTAEIQNVGQRSHQQRREPNPSHIPYRGAFFMHDTRARTTAHGGPSNRGPFQGRDRTGGSAESRSQNPSARGEDGSQQPWKHDLHDTIIQEPHGKFEKRQPTTAMQGYLSTASPHKSSQPVTTSFSSTKVVGKVTIRVKLPGSREPITIPDVLWKIYTRLPDHRPPLRRDKPVRISLPSSFQRFIFPSVERSFIFIPRQLRPNQQNHTRHHRQQYHSGQGYSSPRTSVFGGSIYSASVAASRRSSITGVPRLGTFSPVTVGTHYSAYGRPVVRLPAGGQMPTGTRMDRNNSIGGQSYHVFPPPQQPAYQGTASTTMHQPKPQKTISVTDIESPANLQQPAQHSETQPFHSQFPSHSYDQANYLHNFDVHRSLPQQQHFAGQTHMSAPSITVSAQDSQGMNIAQGSAFYGQQSYSNSFMPHHQFYYPTYNNAGYSGGTQAYIPSNAHQAMPMPSPQSVNMPQPSSQDAAEHYSGQSQGQAPSGMVAHESNGMVFYTPASEAQNAAQGETFQPAESFVPSYAMPGLLPPTPAPDSSYVYHSMPISGMPTQMFYPHS